MAETARTTNNERLARIEEILQRIDKQMTDNGHDGLPTKMTKMEYAIAGLKKGIEDTNERIDTHLEEDKERLAALQKEKATAAVKVDEKEKTKAARIWQVVYQVYQAAVGLLAGYIAVRFLGG